MLRYMEAFAVHVDLSTLQHFFMPQPACRQEVAATSWWSQLKWVHLGQWSGWRLRKPVWPYLWGLSKGDSVGVVYSLPVKKTDNVKKLELKKKQPEKHMQQEHIEEQNHASEIWEKNKTAVRQQVLLRYGDLRLLRTER